MSSATLTAEPLLPTKITGRALHLIGITFLAVALAQIICIHGFSAISRTLTGVFVASDHDRWRSSCLNVAITKPGGRVRCSWAPATRSAAFFSRAASYVGWLPALESTYFSWALSLCLALAASLGRQ